MLKCRQDGVFEAVHIQELENVMTEGISRWPKRQTNASLTVLSPSFGGRRQVWERLVGRRVWRSCSRPVNSRSCSIDKCNLFRGLEDVSELEARWREEKYVLGWMRIWGSCWLRKISQSN